MGQIRLCECGECRVRRGFNPSLREESVENIVCCENHITKDIWAMDGRRIDGDMWPCPGCGERWQHVCDVAEGCSWERVRTLGKG